MKHSTGITRFDHEQESGTVSLSDMSRNGTRRRRVWAASIATLAATFGLATLGVAGLPSAADAVAARPAVPPTAPPTTDPTTPPTLPPPPPPPSDWRVRVEDLVQDPNVGAISADRFWLTLPILTQGSSATAPAGPAAATPGWLPPIVWDPVPAGSAPLAYDELRFPVIPPPQGASVALRVKEAGAPGSLCRTKAKSPVPETNQSLLHLLVPGPISTSAADLNAMVQSLGGPQTGTPAGTKVYVFSASLVPTPAGLQVQLKGIISAEQAGTTVVFFFDYTVPLNLNPVNGITDTRVLTASAPNAGTLALTFFGTPPPNGDFIKFIATGIMEPQLRAAVVSRATTTVNEKILGMHDVKWWTEQGFTLSIRKVEYSANDMKVHPALCRW
jgi:hypothetical protein